MLLVFLFPLFLTASEKQLSTLPLKDNFYTLEVSSKVKSYALGKRFMINPSEMFAVSFKAKALCKPKQFGKIMAGFRQFNAAGRRIYSAHVTYVKGSDAVLCTAAAKGSRIVTVKNSVWALKGKMLNATNTVQESKFDPARLLRMQLLVAVFNTRPDHKDLPNFSVNSSRNTVVKTEERPDGTVLVTLKAPLNRSYAAGTKVRLHLWGPEPDFAYSCWPVRSVQNHQFSKQPSQWLPGAKSAQLIFSFSCRKEFKGLQLQIEKPVVKKLAQDGDLF